MAGGGYRLAIFDFDGTLADTFPLFVPLTNRLAERHGFRPIDPAEADALRGLDTRELMARLGIRAWQMPRIAADYRTMLEAPGTPVPLFAGVPQMLESLAAAGLRLAVLTSNTRQVVERALGPMAARFEAFDCGVSLFGKGRRLRRLVRTSRADPGRTIYVGDELRDLAGARQAGIAFGGVAWGFARPDVLRTAGPDRWFDRMDDVESIA